MEKDDIGFGDILQQAEQLNSEIDSNTELPRVHRNLRQVLEAGQHLLNRTVQDVSQVNAETKASVFLGSKGLDLARFAEKLDPFYMTRASLEPVESAGELDIETYLKNERKNAQLSLVDRSSKQLLHQLEESIWEALETDWKVEKEEILSSLTASLKPVEFNAQKSRSGGKTMEDVPLLSKTEVTYAHEIDNYNKAVINGLPKPNLLEKFHSTAKNSGDKNVEELWDCVVSMICNLPYDPSPSVIERRLSQKVTKSLLSRAKKFLEKNYFIMLQQEVWSNLAKSQLGGSPAVIPLIKGFITIKGIGNTPGLEEGPGDSGPVWAIIYYCLRCGRIADAVKYMRDSLGPNEFLEMLEEYMKNDCESLSKDREYKVRLEYRRVLKTNCQDIYKRVLYCIFGACDVDDDHGDVVSRLDDYLWLKLSQIREDAATRFNSDFITYSGFQNMILEKCGESYFDAFRQPLVYFEALFLTGQFEAAIEFLSRVNSMKIHGIHVAIVLSELNILFTSDSKSHLLVRNDTDPPGIKRLNFFHLISKFAKVIQNIAPKEALNYMYFLRSFVEGNGANLFAVCVSELVMETRDFNLLFGYISSDGCKTPGLLENMGINASSIIEYCASESENNGLLEDAVVLYDLAGKPEQVLKILIRLVALNVSKNPLPDSARQRIQRLAVNLAERFQKTTPHLVDKAASSTFFILVDLMTFFDEYHAQRYENAFRIIERMKIIPMAKDDIERCVANFHVYSDEIRMNIPEVILATMESLQTKYNKLKADRKTSLIPTEGGHPDIDYLLDIKEKVRTIITYCGMIPYFMTSEVYSKLLQIEVQIG